MTWLVRFDWAIKRLLRDKANFDILEGFLSELLKTQIKIEQILESEGNKNANKNKFNRVEMLVKTSEGKHIIIELQCSGAWDYLRRISYGRSKMVCEHLRGGGAYWKICKVISVSIVFFNLGKGKDYLYHGVTGFKGLHYGDVLGLNSEERRAYGQSSVFDMQASEGVFTEFYLIKVTEFQEKIQDKIDEWIYFFKNGKIEKNFSAQGLQSASEKLKVLLLSEDERRAYDHYQESLHDDGSLTLMMDVKYQEGVEEGIKKGTKERIIQVAGSLKNAGLSDQQIAVHTNLSLEEIKRIK